ncbi:hypothetical protein CCH79_00016175 [Gambusia affinis]|uniref:G-protein coupled receptors family 1 profile domain-containing protein n=1 Tax=Gambusia affinis TaxID=33528 RepID=A0A315VNN0_GAMAF|nr:hypothetical protein CCH79_00016175 [Gambusia affinis]
MLFCGILIIVLHRFPQYSDQRKIGGEDMQPSTCTNTERHQTKESAETENQGVKLFQVFGALGPTGGFISLRSNNKQETNTLMENYTLNSFTLQIEGLDVAERFLYPVFFFFLFSYLGIMMLNVGIVILICLDRSLHQPMYLLFCNLPFNDILGVSYMLPRLMSDILLPPAERLIIREALQNNDDYSTDGQDQIHQQVRGAGLQCFPVQSCALAGQTDDGDLGVSHHHAADGSGEQHPGEGQAVHVVDENILAREQKQRGVVTVQASHESPAAAQPHRQAQKDPDQNQRRSPGSSRQLRHHPVGHYGRVAQRVADGHVPVEGHGHQHRVAGGAEHVADEGLEDALVVTDEAVRGRPHDVQQHAGQHD